MAVDPTPAMAASQGRTVGKSKNQDIIPSEANQKPKQPSKKQTRKDAQNIQATPIAGSSKSADPSPWSWKSLTQSSASRVASVFSKDGRCAIIILCFCQCSHRKSKLLFLCLWVFGQDLLGFNGSCCLHVDSNHVSYDFR